MTTKYKYTAKNAVGKNIGGTIEAASQNEAIAELRRQDLIPVKVAPAGGGFSLNLSMGGGKRRAKASAKKGEVVLFTRQLSTMLSAGIPLLESFEVLQEQAESPGFKSCLAMVTEDIRTGADLSNGLGKHPRVFSNIYVSMIKAGEISGQLDVILDRLAEYQEASARLKAEIKSAMTYPVVSLFLVIGIAAFLMIGIVPQFKEIFDSLMEGQPLPAITEYLLLASEVCKKHWMILMGGFFGVIPLFKIFKSTEKGAYVIDQLNLNMPVFGPLFKKVAISRFARTFSTLVKSGVPILGAMEIVADTAGNRVLSNAVNTARESVKQGDTLAEPLSRCKVFPPMVTKMIGIGEKSGSLEALLEKISEFYDDQVSAAVKGLTSLIEPVMIAIMGFLVGGIVLAILLPIFELQGKLAGA